MSCIRERIFVPDMQNTWWKVAYECVVATHIYPSTCFVVGRRRPLDIANISLSKNDVRQDDFLDRENIQTVHGFCGKVVVCIQYELLLWEAVNVHKNSTGSNIIFELNFELNFVHIRNFRSVYLISYTKYGIGNLYY